MSETTVETPPEPLVVADPVLMETLATLDRDVAGESKFCVNAVDALQAFQARWQGDHAVMDAYQDAIRTLAIVPGVLAGGAQRQADRVTRTTTQQQAADAALLQAQATREHALAWSETPVPAPAPAPAPAPDPVPAAQEG